MIGGAALEYQLDVKMALEAKHPRSPKWPSFCAAVIAKHTFCGVCGETPRTTKLIGHHILPYHEFPELELVESNIFVVGEECSSGNHHLLLCHYGDFRKWNPDIVRLAEVMLANRLAPQTNYQPTLLFQKLVAPAMHVKV